MRTNRYLLGVALLVAGVMPAFSQVSNDNEDEVYKIDARFAQYDFVPGQVLVKFKDANRIQVNRARGKVSSTNVSKLTEVLRKYGADEMEQLLPRENPKRQLSKSRAYNGETIQEKDLSQLYQVRLSAEHALEVMPMIEDLKTLDEVEFAEPNYKLYTLEESIADSYNGNPMVSEQWYLDNYGVKELWDKPIINNTRPVIAIIDTGVDLTHPDLVDNLWTNTAEAEGESGYDNDGNGFASDVHGWDFINNTPNIRDNNMHGTHVAGIAAAANNSVGIVGANPQALIMPVTAMQSDGTGDVATIIKGIDYAIANGATVLNMSFGTYAYSSALRQALEKAYQKAVIVAAAGNDRCCINLPHYPVPCRFVGQMFPAAFPFVLGVQATTSTGNLASFSNYDDDGNIFSCVTTLQDPDGFNYELRAPGTNMLSTIPGGKYKELNGTSMAAPLVAGAISALKMVKQYDTQEILWGDLLHSSNIAQAYKIEKRPAALDLMKIQLRNRKDLADETEDDYSNDHEIDAGEIVSIYPVIRNTFGVASNIKLKLELGDFEDPNTVQIQTDMADFGLHLDAYGKGVSQNPLVLKVASNVHDARHISMKILATCDESSQTYEWPFSLVVSNMKKINGLISENMTLTSDHVYLINENLGIMEGATLTIEPGTRIEFMEGMGLSSFGKLVARGTPEKPIIFTGHNGVSWAGIKSQVNPIDTISYCKIDSYDAHTIIINYPYMKDCYLSPYQNPYAGYYAFSGLSGERITMSCVLSHINSIGRNTLLYSNIVNCYFGSKTASSLPNYSQLNRINYLNNKALCNETGKYYEKEYWLAYNSSIPGIDKSDNPSYLGTGREDIVRYYLYELGNAPDTYGQIDLSNMPSRPYSEAHGIVWKVVVNGKDAQDEFEELAPLGVGKHKFEIYFNRPMNKAVAPQIAFGVHDPYTQQTVAEDGSWNTEGTIYTAWKTIDGKTKSDGLNRIYVWGAQDNEFFEIPYEKSRFNIYVQAAGSLATGFAAEAGLGRVNLTWNNTNNNFDDAMGFNIYRYTIDDEGKADTIRINQDIVDIETTSYTDYDVTPHTTYYYMYKVLSTDLQEYDVSNVVAATPQTASLGDANGDTKVNVSDVTATVNYALGMDQKPFIFEAADVNTDNLINVLDVIGIVQLILHPSATRASEAEGMAEVVYTVEDGMLYVDTPVAIGGFQIQLAFDEPHDIIPTETLKGFEQASTWLTDSDYRLMAYSFGNKTLPAGKHAVLQIGDADITSLCFSDKYGNELRGIIGDTTNMKGLTVKRMMNTKGVFNLNGQKVSNSDKGLKHGVYIIDGQKVVK